MSAAGDRRNRLRAMLADLKMPGALEAVDGILAQADSGAVTASEAMEELLNAQIVLRNNRRLQTAMRASRLPAVKTLAQFDFAFQPSIKREQIESLHELGFLERKENVVFLGPPGVGKTHLAISLAIAAAESGRRVYYGTLAGLIESLAEAKAAGNLSRRLRVLTHPSLLVVDEIGYLPVTQEDAVLFFQLINARHEHASTVLTPLPHQSSRDATPALTRAALRSSHHQAFTYGTEESSSLRTSPKRSQYVRRRPGVDGPGTT